MTTKQEIALRNKLHLVCDEVRPVPDNLYGYEKALVAAGVDIINYETFGSHQGRWLAKIRFPNGEMAYVSDYYGSCSGCDAFEAELGFADEKDIAYAHKLKDFGRDYLENCLTFDEAMAVATEHVSWDRDAEDMVAWLNKVKDQTL